MYVYIYIYPEDHGNVAIAADNENEIYTRELFNE